MAHPMSRGRATTRVYKSLRNKSTVEHHLHQAAYHITCAMGSVMWSPAERTQMTDMLAQLGSFVRMNDHRPWNRIKK